MEKLCKVIAYLKDGKIEWRDYIGNIFPLAIPDAKEGDEHWLYYE